eukprot:TRINITY_DN5332_c1_g3_i3.p1 TRINITY_DN5332_c1_g3~~TRINITY_DN5332_c1_g3_i3.p1  ORF type:complete len:1484 (+),score=385.76 TRINITY_DN5332_c1_g3_i3:83-4453(+)
MAAEQSPSAAQAAPALGAPPEDSSSGGLLRPAPASESPFGSRGPSEAGEEAGAAEFEAAVGSSPRGQRSNALQLSEAARRERLVRKAVEGVAELAVLCHSNAVIITRRETLGQGRDAGAYAAAAGSPADAVEFVDADGDAVRLVRRAAPEQGVALAVNGVERGQLRRKVRWDPQKLELRAHPWRIALSKSTPPEELRAVVAALSAFLDGAAVPHELPAPAAAPPTPAQRDEAAEAALKEELARLKQEAAAERARSNASAGVLRAHAAALEADLAAARHQAAELSDALRNSVSRERAAALGRELVVLQGECSRLRQRAAYEREAQETGGVPGAAEGHDAERHAREAESYAVCTGEEVLQQMGQLAGMLEALYLEKEGDVGHELADNLRGPPEVHVEAQLGRLCSALQQAEGAPPGLWAAELLALRQYTQRPADLDRELGWADAPPPQRAGTAAAREEYEEQYNDWDWAAERGGVAQRSGSLFGPVCAALRDQGPGPRGAAGPQGEWSLQLLRRWVKWLCTVAAACAAPDTAPAPAELWRGLGAGGLSAATVAAHRSLRPGDLIGWPALSSASTDERASTDYMLGLAVNSTGRPSPERPGTLLFRICGASTGRALGPLSQYPAEAEHLFGPLTVFRVVEVVPDRRNPFGEGLRIELDCLGPLGGPLAASPRLHRFYARVRSDAARASGRLAPPPPPPAVPPAAVATLQAAAGRDAARPAAQAAAYAVCSGGSLGERMEEFGRFLEAIYDAKQGDVVDELAENLRGPPGQDITAALGRLGAVLQGAAAVGEAHSGLWAAELLALRQYTQRPADLDREVGWADAPPPQQGAAPAAAAIAYEAAFNDWDWAAERGGVAQRSGSLFGPVCAALRDQGPGPDGAPGPRGEWSLRALQRWIKWLCTVAAACTAPGDKALPAELWRGLGAGGVSAATVAAHRSLRPGELLGWPALSSASTDGEASKEYMLGEAVNSVGRPTEDRPGTLLFRIVGANTGRALGPLSQYPAEAEHLFGPLTVFSVENVAFDPSNALGEGLCITLRCLGPLGAALEETPWLSRFYTRVRADAARASRRIGVCSPAAALPPAGPTAAEESARQELHRTEAAARGALLAPLALLASEAARRAALAQAEGAARAVMQIPAPPPPPGFGEQLAALRRLLALEEDKEREHERALWSLRCQRADLLSCATMLAASEDVLEAERCGRLGLVYEAAVALALQLHRWGAPRPSPPGGWLLASLAGRGGAGCGAWRQLYVWLEPAGCQLLYAPSDPRRPGPQAVRALGLANAQVVEVELFEAGGMQQPPPVGRYRQLGFAVCMRNGVRHRFCAATVGERSAWLAALRATVALLSKRPPPAQPVQHGRWRGASPPQSAPASPRVAPPRRGRSAGGSSVARAGSAWDPPVPYGGTSRGTVSPRDSHLLHAPLPHSPTRSLSQRAAGPPAGAGALAAVLRAEHLSYLPLAA